MALSLKSGSTYTSSQGLPLSTAYMAIVEGNNRTKRYTMGVFASQPIFVAAIAAKNQEDRAIDIFYVQMTDAQFAQYFNTDMTKSGAFKPVELLAEIFTNFLLTEQPAVSGKVGVINWSDWEATSTPGLPFTVSDEKVNKSKI